MKRSLLFTLVVVLMSSMCVFADDGISSDSVVQTEELVVSSPQSVEVSEEVSSDSTVQTEEVVLGSLQSVEAKLYGHDDIDVSWSEVEGAEGYNIYLKKGASDTYTLVKQTSETSYRRANLVDGVKYYVKVVPYYTLNGEVVEGSDYKVDTVYTLKKVSSVKALKKSYSKVEVSWKNISGESGYQISRSTKKTGTKIVSTYKTTSKDYKVLSNSRGLYYYKVRAYKVVDGIKIYGPWSTPKKLNSKDTVSFNTKLMREPLKSEWGSDYDIAYNFYKAILNGERDGIVVPVKSEKKAEKFIEKFSDKVVRSSNSVRFSRIYYFANGKFEEAQFTVKDYKSSVNLLATAKAACKEAGVKEGMSKKTAVKKINNWICNHMQYKITNGYALSGFKTGKGQCMTYADMFEVMCEVSNIDCKYCIGIADGLYGWDGHAWNRAYIGGKWYWVDVCWNDTGGDRDAYLLDTKLWSSHRLT